MEYLILVYYIIISNACFIIHLLHACVSSEKAQHYFIFYQVFCSNNKDPRNPRTTPCLPKQVDRINSSIARSSTELQVHKTTMA
jgi:hypothetical protein